MKTPSFFELKTLVEYLSDELQGSQLQEVMTTEDGLVMTFYRFTKNPRTAYLVFDLDKPFPFLGLFMQNPWSHLKKTKPVGLFLNAHAKNLHLNDFELVESLGRVARLSLGQGKEEGADRCEIQIRLIPKAPNLIIHKSKKTISWYPVTLLAENDPAYIVPVDDEQRSIPFLMEQWVQRRGATAKQSAKQNAKGQAASSMSPYEKWKKQRERDIEKKTKALDAIQAQIDKFRSEPWAEVGEFLKNEGMKNVKPEWTPYVNFAKTASQNMQNCFDKAKAAKSKVFGALKRSEFVKEELKSLEDLSDARFQSFLKKQTSLKNKTPVRKIEGRFRKQVSESGIIAYMGKSAADNIDLLRKSKAWDFWMHLKDYPSAHAIIHRQKDQSVSDKDIQHFGSWLVKEGLSGKQASMGGKFSIVIVECRHVKPMKGDKLGRVTYHNAREVLIAV